MFWVFREFCFQAKLYLDNFRSKSIVVIILFYYKDFLTSEKPGLPVAFRGILQLPQEPHTFCLMHFGKYLTWRQVVGDVI